VKELVDQWQGKRILVVGDPGFDVYHHGRVDRLSPEAPVPVFVEERLEDRPGLAYNVCQNLAAFGCRPVQCFPPKPWTVKRRFMVGRHQLFRADYDVHQSPKEEDLPTLEGIDAVVFSDYAKGWLTSWFVREIIRKCQSSRIPTVVDPKGAEWGRYRWANVICPNADEYAAWRKHSEDMESILSGWQRLGPTLVVKQGEKGAMMGGVHYPAKAQHVYDVTGAGDTFVATMAAAMSVDAPLDQAVQLAILSSGFVVGEVGTSACTAATLKGLAS